MNDTSEIRVKEPLLREFCASIFQTLGVSPEDAEVWVDVMLEANLRGVDSHGILVLPMYAAMLEAGGIRLNASMERISDTGSTLLIDGGSGIGPVIANRAMDLAIERASQFGISFVAVRNSNHFGIGAAYVMKSLQHDMVSMAFTNAGPAVAAWGGKSKVVGSNVIAVGVPAGTEWPIVFDAAVGAAAGAKVFLMGERGERIPNDWMIDKNGQATDDPRALFDGGVMLPFGKQKGYGLGLIADVLTGVISGGLFSTSVGHFAQDMSKPLGVCHSFWVLDVKRFMPPDQFKCRIDEMIRNVRQSEPREGFERVFLPGEKGYLTSEDRKRNGIPLHAKLVGNLRQLAQRLSVQLPF